MKMTSMKGGQQGFAALVVAITLVVVLSLLTVGFAQLMRNEQTQNTNRQLSDQAYYAAETGVNDATMALPHYSGNKTYCGKINTSDLNYGGAASQYLSNNNVGPSSANTQWTCLLIYPSPTSLQYGDIDTTVPTVFVTKAQNSDGSDATIDHLVIGWQDSAGSATFTPAPSSVSSPNTTFPTSASWSSSVGVLRAALTPLGGDLSAAGLDAATLTNYLYPSTASASVAPGDTQQGKILDGGCNGSNNPHCSVTINLSGQTAGEPLLFNLRSIYNPSSVTITAYDSSNNKLELVGAQAMIDATGRDQDILKRIQVRIPEQTSYDLPGFSVDSLTGLCKQLSGWPGVGNSGGCGVAGGVEPIEN